MGYDPDELLRRYAVYADRFGGSGAVLDIGCGRDEFLTLLSDRGVRGVGIDADPNMVSYNTQAGRNVVHAEAVSYLAEHRDEFDGIFASHVIEHMPATTVENLVHSAAGALRPPVLA